MPIGLINFIRRRHLDAVVISQKSQYAVRAVLELAKNEGTGATTSARIAAAQCIPGRFLDNILAQLKCAGIVESVRGKKGGHVLSWRPKDLSVGEVVRAVQGCLHPVECLDAKSDSVCPLRAGCVLQPVWERAHTAMMNVLDSTSFQQLLEEEAAARGVIALDYVI